MARYSDQTVTLVAGVNVPVQGVSVYVYDRTEALATLTEDGGGALANPVTSDAYGNFHFNAVDGLYDLSFHYGGKEVDKWNRVQVGTGPELPADIIAALAQPSAASIIGWIRNATGAVAGTIADWFEDRPSVMDFIPFSTRVGIRLRTSTTDVRAYIQAAIDSVNAKGGGDLLVPPGAYRVVINTGVTDKGLIVKDGVRVVAYGATVNMECTGDAYGARLKNNAKIEGGTWAVTVSVSPGSQGIWHSAISLGAAYGEGGTVASPSSFQSLSGWQIRNLTVSSVRSTNGNVVAIPLYGDVSNGLIENITVASSSTLYGCVQADWAYVGTISSGDVPTSRANFDAGTAYTTHPHDILIRNLKIGAMTWAGAIPLRFSGCYGITVENVTIEGSDVAGVYHHCGDLGFELAPAAVKPMRAKGNAFRNITVKDANNGWGFYGDYVGDQIRNAVAIGYLPLLSAIQRASLTIENFTSFSDAGASTVAGIRLQEIISVRIINPAIVGHKQGILVETGADEVSVFGGTLYGNREDGLYANHGSDKPQNLLIDGLRSYQNDTSAGGAAGNIRIEGCDNPIVRNCVLSLATTSPTTTETAVFGFRANTSVTGLTLEDNYVLAIKAGGVGYSIGSSGDYALVEKWSNNRAAAGVATPFGGAAVDIANAATVDLAGSATYDPASLVDGAGATTTVTVTGAALGDFAIPSFSNALQGIILTAWVSAANTVSVRFQNESGGTLDLASGTLRARVLK